MLLFSTLVTLSSMIPFISSCTIVFKPVDTSKDKLDDTEEEGEGEDIVVNSNGEDKDANASN